MFRITKKLVSAILVLVCFSLPILSFSACEEDEGFTGEVNPNELHQFYIESNNYHGVDWAIEKGHVILGEEKLIHEKTENLHLLKRFIKDKKANSEIFIIIPMNFVSSIIYSRIRGLYFDGEYFQTHESFVNTNYSSSLNVCSIYKYKTCDIERYDGRHYLYVANGNSITLREYLKLDTDEKAVFKEKFLIVASWE